MATVYIQSEVNDHLRLNNDTGTALSQYEFTVLGNIACIADEAIANGSVGSVHAEDGLVIQIDATNDGIAGELTFGTVNDPVFWDPSSGDFSDTETSTYYKVGILKTAKNSDGIIEVVVNKQVYLVSALENIAVNTSAISTINAEPKILTFAVTADATGGLAITGLSEGDEIIGAYVICSAANGSGTLKITDQTDDITDAITCAVDTTVTYAGTIDDAYSTLPAGGAEVVANGAADRGVLVITYIPA